MSIMMESALSTNWVRFLPNACYSIKLNCLGMQEAIAHYASNDPVRSHTYYLDSTIGGFGMTLNQLVPGWDCPESATYLDALLTPGSVCVFERDAGFPISRHGKKSEYIS